MGNDLLSDSEEILGMVGGHGSGDDKSLVEAELNLGAQVTGQVDTLRNTILSYVADGKHDHAIRELTLYQRAKSEQQCYDNATDHLFTHCRETIEMIKQLLTSQDLTILPIAKRYDVYNKVKRLFENTKAILVRLEQLENDLMVRDARSVTWFLQSCVFSFFVVFAIAASADALSLAGKPLDVLAADAANFLFSLVGL